jgi:predicted amidohydrolase
MRNVVIACAQPLMQIFETHDEYETELRRYLRQAQAKEASLVVFPELSGLMLAPPLFSSLKLGFLRRADAGVQRGARAVTRTVGRAAGRAADMLGGGFKGSLSRLLNKHSSVVNQVYPETFSNMAREFGVTIVAGSLYLYDEVERVFRHALCAFDAHGERLGIQEKLHLAAFDRGFAMGGGDITLFEGDFGRFGVLIGDDILYPEVARVLAYQGAELLVGVAACVGSVQSALLQRALQLRAEENQVYAAASFLIGPNYLDSGAYRGQSAILAPRAVASKADGVLVQTGTDKVEGVVTAELDGQALERAWDEAGFRPRHDMNMAVLGPAVAEIFGKRLSIEQALHIPDLALPPVMEPQPPIPLVELEEEPEVEPQPEVEAEQEALPEPEPAAWQIGAMEMEAGQPDQEAEPEALKEDEDADSADDWGQSVVDALSLTSRRDQEEV